MTPPQADIPPAKPIGTAIGRRSVIDTLKWLGSAYADWIRLFRLSWYSSIVSIAGQSLSAISVGLAGRSMGAASYGDVVAIVSFFGWFSVASSYSTHALIPRIMADPDLAPASKSAACATAFWLTTALSIIAVIPAVLLLPVGIKQFTDPSLRPVALLYALVFVIGQMNSVLLAISQSAGWLRQWSAIGLLGGTLPVALLLLSQVIGNSLHPLLYMAIITASSLVTTTLSLILFSRGIGGWRRLGPDRQFIKPILIAGRGPWIATISNIIASYGTNTVIAARLSSAELGHYDIVLSLHTWVVTIGSAVTVPALADWSRKLAAREYTAVRADFRLRQRSTTVVMCSAAVVALLFAEPILTFLYGAEYTQAAPILRVLVLTWLHNGIGSWYWYFMFSSGNTGRVAPPNLAFGIPSFILSWVLLTFTNIGLIGAVIARVLGLTAWLVTYEINFRAVMKNLMRSI